MSKNLNDLWAPSLLQKPIVLDKEEFDAVNEEVMYRGIPPYATVESELEGTHLPNYQIYGPGLYFSYHVFEAKQYTQFTGALLVAKLAPDANLVIDRTISEDIYSPYEYTGFECLDCFVGKTDTERFKLAKIYRERGVDAYATAQGDHIAVLNRAKLILRKP